jgi:hypothetical protein
MPRGRKQESTDPVEDQFQVEEPEDMNIVEDLLEDAPDPNYDEPEEDADEDLEEPDSEDEEVETEEPQPEAKKYKVRGREYTLEELEKEGLLGDIVTQSEQVAHYQELYHGLKQQVEGRQPQGAPQVQPQPQQLRPDQVRAAMQPLINQAVQAGFIDQDFAEDFPNAAATQMYVYSDYMQLKQLVAGMYQYFMQENQQKIYNTVRNNFDTFCDHLSSRHPVYTNLKTPEEKERFFDYLRTKVNPEAGAINEEFLGQVYLAFQQNQILPAMQQGVQQRTSKKKKQRKLAAGEGGTAPRKDLQHKARPSDDQLVLDGMFDHFKQ